MEAFVSSRAAAVNLAALIVRQTDGRTERPRCARIHGNPRSKRPAIMSNFHFGFPSPFFPLNRHVR